MAISGRMLAFRDEMLAFLAERSAYVLRSIKRQPEVALELCTELTDLLREAERVSQRATADDECIAAMWTAAVMLRLIADDMDAAAIERAKISASPSWPNKSKG